MKKLLLNGLFLLAGFTMLYAQPGGYALDFDGVDDYVHIPGSADFNMYNSSFTIEFWVWSESTGSSGEHILVECGNGWAAGTYQLTTFDDDRLQVNFYGRSS